MPFLNIMGQIQQQELLVRNKFNGKHKTMWLQIKIAELLKGHC